MNREVSLGKVPPGIVEESFVGSPDSRRVAYVANTRGHEIVMVDGVEGKEYNQFVKGTLCFSPDSKRVAYAMGRVGDWRVVVDGVEGKPHD